jgi:aspartate aminotransferase-like enzyme
VVPKYRLLTPGPVPVPEAVREAMARTVLHHRAPEFLPVLEQVRRDLKSVFQTEREVLILATSGTGAMEAAVANAFSAGDRVVVVRGGKFGARWAELCKAYGVEALCIDVEWGRAVEPEAVRAAFVRAPDARALLVQASETSTGVYHPIRELCELVHEQPERLMVVDGISGVGVHDLPMDAWGIDVLVSGSQKSWMLPPGMAFIALSEAAEQAVRGSTGPRYYLDLRKALESQPRNQTAFSPPVSLLVGLGVALRLILDEGLQKVFARHRGLAEMTRVAMRALGLELFAPDAPAFSCTAVKVPEGIDAGELIRRLRDVYGITLAGGQGQAAGKIFRVGHMGDVDGFDILTAIAALEMAIADLGLPVKVGEGTRAATEILRDLLSEEVH